MMGQLHPIQLEIIGVKRIEAEIFDHSAAMNHEGEIEIVIENAISPFDEKDSVITVGARAYTKNISDKNSEERVDGDLPFHVFVEIFGHFKVDTNKFSIEDLPRWGQVNAPLLIMPYLREHIYAAGMRLGIKNLIFPLIMQPQFAK